MTLLKHILPLTSDICFLVKDCCFFHCRAVKLCLEAVVSDNLRVTVATHNLKSAELALSQVQSSPKLKSGVNFAQINGLGDHISMALSLQGCQVLKLLPCGTVDEVLPWLSRYLFFHCNNDKIVNFVLIHKIGLQN